MPRGIHKELTPEQRNIQEQARTVVKILGMLESLSEWNLCHIREFCNKRIGPGATTKFNESES